MAHDAGCAVTLPALILVVDPDPIHAVSDDRVCNSVLSLADNYLNHPCLREVRGAGSSCGSIKQAVLGSD